jgi:hypothetical protein
VKDLQEWWLVFAVLLIPVGSLVAFVLIGAVSLLEMALEWWATRARRGRA